MISRGPEVNFRRGVGCSAYTLLRRGFTPVLHRLLVLSPYPLAPVGRSCGALANIRDQNRSVQMGS